MSFKTFLESTIDSDGFFTDMKSIMLFLQKQRISQFKPDATTKQIVLKDATFTGIEEAHLPIRIIQADNITINASKITSLLGLPRSLDRLVLTGCPDLNDISQLNGLPRTYMKLTLNSVGVRQLNFRHIDTPFIQINECNDLESIEGGGGPGSVSVFNCKNLKSIHAILEGTARTISIGGCPNFKFGEDSLFNAVTMLLDGNLSLSGISIGGPVVQYIQFHSLDGITNILSLIEMQHLRSVTMSDGNENFGWLRIVNEHLKRNNRDVFDLQSDLIEAGYESIAQL